MELTELGYYPKKVAKSQPQKPARNRCHASTCSSVRPCCHLSDKNYRFSDNLPHSQIWILRKFADSWSGSGGAENAPLLAKQIDTFSTVELLFNISKLA